MKTKGVIMGLLILGLVVVEIEAKSCCKNTLARNCYNTCRFAGTARPKCASICQCKIIDKPPCPKDYPKNILEISGSTISDYCKLGCESSICDTMITELESGKEEVKLSLENCKEACSKFCKGGKVELVTS